MSWAVVVPSNRPDRLAQFGKRWERLFAAHDVELIVVHDEPDTWRKLPACIPPRSDMIRSFGFLQAWESDVDYVLTLDDDTSPLGDNDILAEYEAVFDAGAPLSPYLSVGGLTSSGLQMRGFPFRDRKPATVAVQYGGWCGVLDYDAPTQLAAPSDEAVFSDVVMPVPAGAAVTGCIMNCAFRREATPIMWQLPLLDGRYNRWGDIWSCLFAKRTLDAIGEAMVINGAASVVHDRASDPIVNLGRELPGIAPNEDLWARLPVPQRSDMVAAYVEVTDIFAAYMRIEHDDAEYAATFTAARDEWLRLLEVR